MVITTHGMTYNVFLTRYKDQVLQIVQRCLFIITLVKLLQSTLISVLRMRVTARWMRDGTCFGFSA